MIKRFITKNLRTFFLIVSTLPMLAWGQLNTPDFLSVSDPDDQNKIKVYIREVCI